MSWRYHCLCSLSFAIMMIQNHLLPSTPPLVVIASDLTRTFRRLCRNITIVRHVDGQSSYSSGSSGHRNYRRRQSGKTMNVNAAAFMASTSSTTSLSKSSSYPRICHPHHDHDVQFRSTTTTTLMHYFSPRMSSITTTSNDENCVDGSYTRRRRSTSFRPYSSSFRRTTRLDLNRVLFDSSEVDRYDCELDRTTTGGGGWDIKRRECDVLIGRNRYV